jgi:hypothetical protein
MAYQVLDDCLFAYTPLRFARTSIILPKITIAAFRGKCSMTHATPVLAFLARACRLFDLFLPVGQGCSATSK